MLDLLYKLLKFVKKHVGEEYNLVEVLKIVDKDTYKQLHDEQLMYVYSQLERMAYGEGIVLDSSEFNDMLVGLPFVIPFVIGKLDDYKLESIEIYTDRTTMVMPEENEDYKTILKVCKGEVHYYDYSWKADLYDDESEEDPEECLLTRRDTQISEGEERKIEQLMKYLIGRPEKYEVTDCGDYEVIVRYEGGFTITDRGSIGTLNSLDSRNIKYQKMIREITGLVDIVVMSL